VTTLALMPARAAASVSLRRVCGAAGLGYVIAAGVENMELLGAPLFDAPAAEIRAAYADRALSVVTTTAGVLSLAFYCVFVAGLFSLTRSRAALFGLAAVALGAVGLSFGAVLVIDVAALSDATVRSLFELQLFLRLVAGPLMALFLLGMVLSPALPSALRWAARGAAVPLVLGPVAAVTGADAVVIVAIAGFGLHSLWIWAVSLWLTVGADVRRAAFLMLVLAAGLVGVALLAVPEATGSFFAWELKPAGLAAFAGGVYVGSAAVYGAGLRASWREARALVVGAVVLSVSVFAITLVHAEVFDFGRLQAWAWVVLFAGFGLMTIALVVRCRASADAGATRLGPGPRGALAAVAAGLAASAIALWTDPGMLDLPPLGGRFAGSWVALLAVLSGSAALHDRRDEAHLPALALVALPAGALAGALRTGTLEAGYLAALLVPMAVGLLVLGGAGTARRATR
jgi:hypothetical protein